MMYLRRWFTFVVCSLLALSWAAHLEAQTVSGAVLDEATLQPVAGAEVLLLDSAGNTLGVEVTGSEGTFQLVLNSGVYSFNVLRMGYLPTVTEALEITPGVGPINLTITLPSDPMRLESVVVEGREEPHARSVLAEFYRRKERGWGVHLDREAVEERAPVWFTDILRNIAGVRVVSMGGNKTRIEMTGQPPRIHVSYLELRGRARAKPQLEGCPISYYVEGFKFRPDQVEGRGINEIPASQVEAVEVYRRASETPAEFLDSDSRCGVIVIWLKRDR
jgi:hypothetical protein